MPALLYLLTVYPGVGGRFGIGDAIRFQFSGSVLSIPHEPGYPQYVVLSFLWTQLPLPVSLATEVNLLSVVFALVAGAVLFSLARRLSSSAVAAVLATWALLTSYDIWRFSTQAEVYSLNLMWVAVVVWVALRWSDSKERRWLVALLFAYALSFGNHLSMIALLPAILYLVLATDASALRDPRMLAAGAAAIVVGLSQYSLLLWRSYHPVPTLLRRFPERASLGELLRYMSGTRFTERHMGGITLDTWLGRLVEAFWHGMAQLGPLFILMALGGAALVFVERRRFALFLLLILLATVPLAATYDIRDWLFYCAPAWLVLVALAAAGIGGLSARWPAARRPVIVALVLSLCLPAAANYADLRVRENPLDHARLAAEVAPGSIFILGRRRRHAVVLSAYYEVSGELGEEVEVRFMDADGALDRRQLFLGRYLLYSQDDGVIQDFEDHDIDWARRELAGWPRRSYLVTGTDDPLTGLRVEPLSDGAIAVVARGERRLLADRRSLYFTFVAAADGRSIGSLEIPLDDEGGWAPVVADLLRNRPREDWILLVAPQLEPGEWSLLQRYLTVRGVPQELLPVSAGRLVAAWNPARRHIEHFVVSTLDRPVQVSLPR